MEFINYNGQLVSPDHVPPLLKNSVFRHETGLFESMLVIDGEVQLASYHYERLLKGLERTGMTFSEPIDKRFVAAEVDKTIGQNRVERFLRLRLQIFQEEQKVGSKASFVIEGFTISPELFSFNDAGLRIGLLDAPLKKFDRTANAKTINLALYTHGADLAKSNGWDDFLLVHNDQIVESGTSNLFWVKDGIVFTPPLSEGCIEGTMRRHVITSMSNKYEIHEQALHYTGLDDADEVFLTNAVRRIKWVGQIGNRIYSNLIASSIHSALFS